MPEIRQTPDWRWTSDVSSNVDDDETQALLVDLMGRSFSGGGAVSVLDIGCGDGRRTVSMLVETGVEVDSSVWIDPSPFALSSLKETLIEVGLTRDHELRCSRFERSAIEGQFDLILSLHSMYCQVDDLPIWLGRVMELLSPRGLAVVELSLRESPLFRLQTQTRELTGQPIPAIARGEDVTSWLESADAAFSCSVALETLRLGEVAPNGLSTQRRVMIQWLNGGAPVAEPEQQAISRLIDEAAGPSGVLASPVAFVEIRSRA